VPQAKRILCVDDDQDTRDLLTTMLGSSGLEAICVRDVAGALRLMETGRFSLHVLEAATPGVSGLEFCEDIRRVDKNTPVVFFSGRALDSDREAGRRAGANAYVVKPDVSELVSTVQRLLDEG
jgi:two-component system phosphate regulon response regulator PhoB